MKSKQGRRSGAGKRALQMRSVDDLTKHLDRLYSMEPIAVTPADCVYIFTKVRQIIEGAQLYQSYGTLAFYCNWALHVAISESGRGYSVMQDLAEVIAKDAADGFKETEVNANDRVNEILSTKELRQDLLQLFRSYQIKTFLFDRKEVWDQILGLLMREIVEKPIRFREPPSSGRFAALKKKYETALSSIEANGLRPEEFKLVGVSGEPIKWHLRVTSATKSIDCTGVMCFTESDSAFVPQ